MAAAIPVIVGFVTSQTVVTAMVVGAIGGVVSGGGLKGALKGALLGAVTAGIAQGIQGIAAGGSGAASAAASESLGSSIATGAGNQVVNTAVGGMLSSDSGSYEPTGWINQMTGGESISDSAAFPLTGATPSEATQPLAPNTTEVKLPSNDGTTGIVTQPVQQPQADTRQLPTGEPGFLDQVTGGISRAGQWAKDNPEVAKLLGSTASGAMSGILQGRLADRKRKWDVEDRDRIERNARWVYTGS